MSKHEDLMPAVKPSDWSAATKKLAAGDGAPMVALLRNLDWPISLVKLFAEVLASAKACRGVIDQGPTPEALPTLKNELECLCRIQPTSLEQSQQIAQRIKELRAEEPRLINAWEFAKNAREQLGTLHDAFPELLGPRPADCSVKSFALSPDFDFYVMKHWPDLSHDITQWRDLNRQAAPAQPRMRIVSAIGNPPKPPH